jgi:hypothetical protein
VGGRRRPARRRRVVACDVAAATRR